MRTDAEILRCQLALEANADWARLEHGEMSLREARDFYQAIVDARIGNLVAPELRRRVNWLLGQGIVRDRDVVPECIAC